MFIRKKPARPVLSVSRSCTRTTSVQSRAATSFQRGCSAPLPSSWLPRGWQRCSSPVTRTRCRPDMQALLARINVTYRRQ